VIPYEEDPWTTIVTVGGLAADEVISALQKSIRRGDLENAVLCALEMFSTSAELEDKLWDRLCVIAVEDVGFGTPDMVVAVVALERARRRFDRSGYDRALFAVHAVRLLVESPKDRSTDELLSWIRGEISDGRRPEIIDAALDMHTKRGQEMGRGLEHFLLEASRVEHEMEGRELRWRKLLLDRLGVSGNQP